MALADVACLNPVERTGWCVTFFAHLDSMHLKIDIMHCGP